MKTSGPNISYLVPLALVMLGLIGHALRESSAGYAFGAGLVAEMAVILGYALHVTSGISASIVSDGGINHHSATGRYYSGGLGPDLVDRTALGRCVARRKNRNHTDERTNWDGHFGKCTIDGNWQSSKSFWLMRLQPEWAMHAGVPLGWCALLLTAGAGAYRRLQIKRHWDPHFVGLTGMAVLALLACTMPNIVLPDGTTSGRNLGVSRVDAGLVDLCVIGGIGHLVGGDFANAARCRRAAAGLDPLGGGMGASGRHCRRNPGTKSGFFSCRLR